MNAPCRQSTRLGASACALMAALSVGSLVHAQPTPEEQPPAPEQPSLPSADPAELAIQKGGEGVAWFERGDYDKALALFREADALYHSPVLLLYVARSQRKLGKLLEARATYQALAKETIPSAAPPTWPKAQADGSDDLRILEAEIPRVTVVVGRRTPQTRVTLDGVTIQVGVPSAENPGEHRVEVVDGAQRFSKTLVLEAGQPEQRVSFELAPPPPKPRQGDEGLDAWRIFGITSLSVGGASLLASAIIGGLAFDKANTAAEKLPPSCTPEGECPDFVDPTDVEEHYEDAYLFANVADGLLIGGGILAGAGILVLVLDPGKDVSVTAAPGGVIVRGSF